MTAPLSPWPPTPEQIEAWAAQITRRGDYAGTPEGDTAAFLRDPRLAAALALWEAVEWIEANRPAIYRERGRWGALHGDTDVIGKTLPEAVQALKARLHQGKEV